MFIYGSYMLIAGRFWMLLARGHYLYAEGNMVRWLGFSTITFTTLLGMSLFDLNFLERLLPFTLLAFFIACILGLVVQSQARLVKKDIKK